MANWKCGCGNTNPEGITICLNCNHQKPATVMERVGEYALAGAVVGAAASAADHVVDAVFEGVSNFFD